MSIYTLISIAVLLLFLGAIGGLLMFINWLDKRIDKRDRLGKRSIQLDDDNKNE
jgi:hypothetical protein